MKIPSSIALTALLFCSATLSSLHADETLWNVTFKDLKPGATPGEVPYSPDCTGPQKVSVDAQDTLAGAKALGPLNNPLVFTKGGNGHYLPSLTFKGTAPLTSGIVTVNIDLEFDTITPTAEHPVETLMAFPFINGDGGSTYIPMIACNGPGNVFLGAAGLAKGKTPVTATTGAVIHLKAVLDLDKHTFQLFLNDQPMADPEHDDAKFNSFLGLTVRDGTALGGNNGATFTAGIGSIVITHS